MTRQTRHSPVVRARAVRMVVAHREVRARAVRMVVAHRGEHASEWAATGSIASKIGRTAAALRGWVRRSERDQGRRAGPTTAERERIRSLEREVRERRELRRANAIPRKAAA